ncbi:NADH-quinone oxidoreductase subunit C [Fervidibacillus halotolerans]|nr:NADH-quinone oxidoreductase subunit C [Fervidibacillus halotolerans]
MEKGIDERNQELIHYVNILKNQIGENGLEDYYINELAKHTPTIVVKQEVYQKVAKIVKSHPDMQFEYLTELHGTDFQTHMEVFLYLQSISRKRSLILKTKTDRDQPIVASVTSIWEGAMWPECEAYDLLGIRFEGHPNLHRIFLGEDWKGYPLRKDYKDENPLK